ncbi:MAG: PAS domain S-box protein [Actinomycetota bacterium]
MRARGSGDARRVPAWALVPGLSLKEQVELFASIAMSAPSGVIASDLEGRIVWVNPVAAEMFGWPREELMGQPFVVVLPPEHHEMVLHTREQILRNELTEPFLTTGLRRDGTRFDVSVTPGVRRDADGQALGTNVVLRDVTEELRVQRELTEALARSRARFDQSAKPQGLLDINGRFVEVNDAACRLLGWPRDELVGRDSTEVVHPRDPDRVREQLALLRDGGLPATTYETTGIRKDGSQVALQIDITAVRDDHGRAYEFAAFARDLTELREAQAQLASQAAFFRGLNRESSDATLVADERGHLVYVSPSTEQVLGHRPRSLLDVAAEELAHPDDLGPATEVRSRLLAAPGSRERFTLRLRTAEGEWRWFEATATNCLDDPDVGGLVVNLRDVTAQMAAQAALRESEARYRAIAETAQEGIFALSLEGTVLFGNERLADILGLDMQQVYELGDHELFRGAPDALAAAPADLPAGAPIRYDLPYHHPDGSEHVLLVSASRLADADGSLLGTLAMVSDVTEQRSAEASLRHQALHDPLTGLANRSLFFDRLATADARRERSGQGAVGVLFLDLDDFKRVNDEHGHQAGDQVLEQVARRLSHAVRATDTVARLGGDEFAVICEEADEETLDLVSARIAESLAVPVAIDDASGMALEVTASIGTALSPPHDVDDLVKRADAAMYRSKSVRPTSRIEDSADGADAPAE